MDLFDISRRRRLVWAVLAAIALVALGDVMFFQKGYYAGYLGLYLFALLLTVLLVRPAVRHDRRAWIAIIAATIFASALVLDPGPLAWTMFWVAAGMAVLFPATAKFDDGWRWFQRLLIHAARSLIAPMIDAWRVSKVRRARRRQRSSLGSTLSVVALPLIGSLVIVALFAAANPVLDRMLTGLFLFDVYAIHPGRLLLWTLLFFMAWSLLHPHACQKLLGTFDGSGDLPLPGVSVASVTLSLIAFNLLFALQNLMDAAYLGGFVAMPEGMTLAEYAHRGAYPLIATALLAALFVLVTLRPGSTTASVPAIRGMVILWVAQNILLVGSSILRTLDYIEAYSLTQLRIAALAWMALVAIGLFFICWRMLRGKSASWLINVNLSAAALVLTGFCYVDTAGMAAAWNVRHAREAGGRGAALDLCYMRELGRSSLAPLISLEQRPGLRPEFRDRVQAVRTELLQALATSMADGGWTVRGQQQLDEAQAMLAARPKGLALRPGERNCDGSIYVPPKLPEAVVAPVSTPAPTPAVTTTPLPEKAATAQARALTAETER